MLGDKIMQANRNKAKFRRREFLAYTLLGVASLTIPHLAKAGEDKSKGGRRMAHELPPLPYEYNALEPYYSEEILRLHHDKHHAAYVTGLNTAEEKINKMLESGDFTAANAVANDLAFHGSGHILHSIFWTNMKPGGGGEPSGELMEMIKKQFKSFEAFKNLFLAMTNAVQGSGWGILAYNPMFDNLVILGAEKHENRTQWGVQPILVCDVWEHAYYLQYQNRRADWTKAFMDHLVNWEDVSKRLSEAKSLHSK
jgi:Fe-Mn family superoxide dismutase